MGSSIQHFGELFILFLPFIYGEFIVHHRICPNVDRCCTAKFVAHGLPAYLLKHGTAIDRLQLKQVPDVCEVEVGNHRNFVIKYHLETTKSAPHNFLSGFGKRPIASLLALVFYGQLEEPMYGHSANVERCQPSGCSNRTRQIVSFPSAIYQALQCMNEEGFSSSSNTAHKHSEWFKGAGTLPRFMLYLMKKVGLKDSPLVKVKHFHPVIKSEVIGLVCS